MCTLLPSLDGGGASVQVGLGRFWASASGHELPFQHGLRFARKQTKFGRYLAADESD